MTAKEVAIEIFKLKIPTSIFEFSVSDGHLTSGCKFTESNNVCHIGISTTKTILVFNSIVFELETHEYAELKKIYDDRKLFIDFENSEILKKKQKKDFQTLSEVASKENVNSSRRVLTEKHTNYKF